MASLRNCCSAELASYAKPACDVVTETRPCRFHRRFPSSTASELSKPATLLNPGVWEFRNLRSLFIDLFRLLCHHPGFECNRRSGFFDACNLPSPAGWRLFGSTLITSTRSCGRPIWLFCMRGDAPRSHRCRWRSTLAPFQPGKDRCLGQHRRQKHSP